MEDFLKTDRTKRKIMWISNVKFHPFRISSGNGYTLLIRQSYCNRRFAEIWKS